MKKRQTARSVRAKRSGKLNYNTLENRQLLAADLFSANALQVCELPSTNSDQSVVVTNSLVNDVPTVTVGDGTDNRSIVESLDLEFSTIVEPDADSFSLVQRESGESVELVVEVDNSDGFSRVHIRFTGELTEAGGSLVDSNYELTVAADLLGDGGGSDFVFGDSQDDGLYRFFGDTDGDRSVDVFELLKFRRTWTLTASDDGFDSRFDVNGDDRVNIVDFLNFRNNYAETLEWTN